MCVNTGFWIIPEKLLKIYSRWVLWGKVTQKCPESLKILDLNKKKS